MWYKAIVAHALDLPAGLIGRYWDPTLLHKCPPENRYREFLIKQEVKDMKDGKRFITINTDGSYKNGIGGFGYYIKADTQEHEWQDPTVHTHYGAIDKCPSSLHAEVMAILYAFIDAWGRGLFERPEIVVVNSDCKEAIWLFQGKKEWYDRSLLQEWRDIEKQLLPRKIFFKYVPAHTDGAAGREAREFVNSKVDELAKKGRRLLEK